MKGKSTCPFFLHPLYFHSHISSPTRSSSSFFCCFLACTPPPLCSLLLVASPLPISPPSLPPFSPRSTLLTMNNFFDTFGSVFGSGDRLPWTDRNIIANFEREAAGMGSRVSEESEKSESYMRFSWALVHSRESADVQRGIAMLEAALASRGGPDQKREILYLIAVGHYRAGNYVLARRYVDQALEISPDFRQGASLRKMIEDKIAKDGVIGIGIAAAAVGIVASGIAAAIARKR